MLLRAGLLALFIFMFMVMPASSFLLFDSATATGLFNFMLFLLLWKNYLSSLWH